MVCGLFLSSPDISKPQHFPGSPPSDSFVCTKQTTEVKKKKNSSIFLHHFISNYKCQTVWKGRSLYQETLTLSFYYKILFYRSFSFWLIIGNYGCAPLKGLGGLAEGQVKAAEAVRRGAHRLYKLQFQFRSTPHCLSVDTDAVDLVIYYFMSLLLKSLRRQTRGGAVHNISYASYSSVQLAVVSLLLSEGMHRECLKVCWWQSNLSHETLM